MLADDTPMDDLPLEYKPKNTSFPQISDEMVASVALGLEDELIVASRHGLSVEQYQELAVQPWFQLQVQVKRSEYEKNGVTFKAKAAWMAGELLDQVYVTAASGDASLSQKHEVLKTLIKAAGLEPKEEKVKDSGPGFSISIDLGGGQSISLSNQQGLSPVTHVPVTLDAEVKEIKNA
jgi:hypothetical protein